MPLMRTSAASQRSTPRCRQQCSPPGGVRSSRGCCHENGSISRTSSRRDSMQPLAPTCAVVSNSFVARLPVTSDRELVRARPAARAPPRRDRQQGRGRRPPRQQRRSRHRPGGVRVRRRLRRRLGHQRLRPRAGLALGPRPDPGDRRQRRAGPRGGGFAGHSSAAPLAPAGRDRPRQPGRRRRRGCALRRHWTARCRMLLRRLRREAAGHFGGVLRHRPGDAARLPDALPLAHALRRGPGDHWRERRGGAQLCGCHAGSRGDRRACRAGRLRGLGGVAARLRHGARLGAGPLSGAAARRADAAAPPAVCAPRGRAGPADRAGAQLRRQRGRGSLVSRRGVSPRGDRLNMSDYAAFAARLTEGGVITDPWFEGEPRFHPAPVVLTRSEQASLHGAAEEMAAAYNELCLLDPALVCEFLGLTPVQQALWFASAPQWHGIARADVFLTEAGPVICELNGDTPTGQAEAVLLNAAVAPSFPALADPNRALGDRLCAMIAAVRAPASIGLIYPTEMPEDLSLVLLYRRWFEERGWRVTLGSPFNLRRLAGGRAGLFDT